MSSNGEPLKVSHHSIKFAGRSHCDTADIMILIFRVILQESVIKGLCNFRGGSHGTLVAKI